MRLQVFLSHHGVVSRRGAMDVIKDGRVCVNGSKVIEPSFDVCETDKVMVDGKPIEVMAYQYVILNKPVGVTTTKDDPHAAQTVMDLLPANLQHLSPVGRLDRDSSGLLLLTNDGQCAYRLTHPSFEKKKTYLVTVKGELDKAIIAKLQHGVDIKEDKGTFRTAPCQIKDVHYNSGLTEFMMTIHEGRKRQIRLMLQAVGYKVNTLKRLTMGTLSLGDLPEGKWRLLTQEEISLL